MREISFSHKTKQELSKIENKKNCCERAEVYALMLFSKYFNNNGKLNIENPLIARLMAEKVAVITGIIPEITINPKGKGYTFSLVGKGAKKFAHVFFEQTVENAIAYKNIQSNCCEKSFLRGAFLACGVISDPSKQYKLEFVFTSEKMALELLNFVDQTGLINLKLSSRASNFVLYSKSSSQIEDFLTYIGAQNTSMEIMQTKMYKEAMNDINRKANFETANIDKTYSASAKQIAAIAVLVDNNQFEMLPHNLKEVADFRFNHPDMTLGQIAKSLNISRSAVNHRLGKIIKLTENLSIEVTND
ncbi:MAG: DNA-binding protein WhiA [Clostridia bacterium]